MSATPTDTHSPASTPVRASASASTCVPSGEDDELDALLASTDPVDDELCVESVVLEAELESVDDDSVELLLDSVELLEESVELLLDSVDEDSVELDSVEEDSVELDSVELLDDSVELLDELDSVELLDELDSVELLDELELDPLSPPQT